MNAIFYEVLIILLLVAVNGLFAMTEIAVVSARRSRLRQLSEAGDRRARLALSLADSPNRFLSTVQVGITLVGILAGAFGGATIAEELGKPLSALPGLESYGKGVALALVVVAITCLSLILGELVPKRIGLARPESIALVMARPMQSLATATAPLIRFLSFSTDTLLRLFGVSPGNQSAVSEDEVRGLMQEGLRAGAFNKVETRIVGGALELDRLPTRALMTPRTKITWVNKNDPHETVWHKIVVSGHSHFPVFEGNRDNAVGMVSLKAIYANLAAGIPVRIGDLMTPPLVVPDTQDAVHLLDTFKQSRKHIALVADEFGGIVGLVSLHDVMEAVIGEFPSQEERAKPRIQKRDDGTCLIDGLVELDALEASFPGIPFRDQPECDYTTLAGFVLKRLGHVPREGETFDWHGYRFEVLDMDRHRIDKVLVTLAEQPSPQI